MLARVAIVGLVLAAMAASAVGYVKKVEHAAYAQGYEQARTDISAVLAADAMAKKQAADAAEKDVSPVPDDMPALIKLCNADEFCREHAK